MDLKQYLRGLGAGILVTAVILGFSQKTKPMTDAEIKVRAAQLGMVEETVLSDLVTEEKSSSDGDTLVEEYTQESNEASTEDTTQLSTQDLEEATKGETVIEEESYVVITVEPGNGSSIISNKLYEAGVIASKEEYNEYLLSKGYDRRLIAGEYRVPMGASMEEITRILCGIE